MDRQTPFNQLVFTLKQQPRTSLEWKQAMNQLLYELQQSPEIIQSTHPDYLDALHRTWEWLSRSIDQFEPRQTSVRTSLIHWVNGYLRWRIRDLYAPDKSAPVSLDRPLKDGETTVTRLDMVTDRDWSRPTLSQLDQMIAKEQEQQTIRTGHAIQQYIQNDPKGELRNCYPRKHAECDCHFLVKRRLLQDPPVSFVMLAEQLNMSKTKVTNHWYGRCLPQLQAIATTLGYQRGQDV